MPHVCPQRLLGGPASEPTLSGIRVSLPPNNQFLSCSSPPHTCSHSKPIARKFQNGFLQEAVSTTLRRSCFPPARDSPRRSVADTALTLNAVDNADCLCVAYRHLFPSGRRLPANVVSEGCRPIHPEVQETPPETPFRPLYDKPTYRAQPTARGSAPLVNAAASGGSIPFPDWRSSQTGSRQPDPKSSTSASIRVEGEGVSILRRRRTRGRADEV